MLQWSIWISFSLAFGLTVLFANRVLARDPVELRTHWGGLGGGTAGWRASPSLIALVGGSVAWLVTAALGLYSASAENERLRDQLRRQEEAAKATLEDQRTKLTRDFELAKLSAERELARWKAEQEFELKRRELELSTKAAAKLEAAAKATVKPGGAAAAAKPAALGGQ